VARKAVFFDLGGTLLVMRRDRIFRKVVNQEGRDASIDEIHSVYMGLEPWWLGTYSSRTMSPAETTEAYRRLDQEAFSRLFPDSEPGEALRVAGLVRARWPELEKEIPLELYPDVRPALESLYSRRLHLGLISNAPADTGRVVEALGLRRYITNIVISGAVGYTKPNPEIFRIALRNARVQPADAVHVGDVYEADVVGARNAGMEGILLDRQNTSARTDCPVLNTLERILDYV
jgi:HAD superfamily hydrolase (TIGR01549 family)